VGYWRFESGGFLLDSSGNDRSLTTPGASAAPTELARPNSGDGADFPEFIPATGQSNDGLARFDGGDRFQRADEPAFTDTSFTIEAFVNTASLSGSQKSVAGLWSSTDNQRSWLFSVGGSLQLNFLLSTTGSNTITVVSTLPALELDKDYYIGLSVNVADTSANGLTFFQQNLTDGGPLLSQKSTHTGTNLFDANVNFTIGSTDQPSSQWSGLIDEVRYSDSRLAASELLVVPEPSTLALLGVSLGFFVRRRRKT
jgi:hypothetical protein